MTHLKVWKTKYEEAERPRRLLACDGGGIKGIISLEILKKIESQLAEMTGKGKKFRLGDYFDYIGGTSTGAIIATGLAVGMSVDELIKFYVSAGPDMFQKARLLSRLSRFYKADPLKKQLKAILGQRTLGAKDLHCLLMVVTQNATTGSPWPVTNNPHARYNKPKNRPDNNLQIPLWQLVRASTAAPVFFPPEILEWEKGNPEKSFVFVDGGVTPYNNPAFLLFRHAVGPQYKLEWPTGEDKMMLVSVGTGSAAQTDLSQDEQGNNLIKNAQNLPSILMAGAAVDQDINCRTVGRCVFGAPIDRELGDMKLSGGDRGRAFLYARFDPDVSAKGLKALGLGKIDPAHVQAMDKVEYLGDMQTVGKTYAKSVDMTPFGKFV